MRGLIELAVTRRVTVIMTALAVVAFGVVGYSRLTLELFPAITYPSLTVQTDFPDTAPEEVEHLVTRPVEEAVGVLSGLKLIHSVSRAGTSEVSDLYCTNDGAACCARDNEASASSHWASPLVMRSSARSSAAEASLTSAKP